MVANEGENLEEEGCIGGWIDAWTYRASETTDSSYIHPVSGSSASSCTALWRHRGGPPLDVSTQHRPRSERDSVSKGQNRRLLAAVREKNGGNRQTSTSLAIENIRGLRGGSISNTYSLGILPLTPLNSSITSRIVRRGRVAYS